MPESWEWVRLGDVCQPFRYGTSAKSAKVGKVPVLRMGNIQNGEIDWSNLVYTSDESEIEKYILEKYDLLFNRTNSRELVGKTAIYRAEWPAIFAGYLIQVKPILSDSSFVNFIMNSEYGRNYCKCVKSDGINQSNVNAQKLGNYPIPLPPLSEQKRIVGKLEELLPLCYKLAVLN
ncbi:restriction endonuclease subunit S [Anaerovibrio sp.]|uniref:restriction endonuclease subunit S n=1 Tax=Anaerovibrio sp. TaxID=1872532 RepID=UPI00388FC584